MIKYTDNFRSQYFIDKEKRRCLCATNITRR